jgi:hypothetical protein
MRSNQLSYAPERTETKRHQYRAKPATIVCLFVKNQSANYQPACLLSLPLTKITVNPFCYFRKVHFLSFFKGNFFYNRIRAVRQKAARAVHETLFSSIAFFQRMV